MSQHNIEIIVGSKEDVRRVWHAVRKLRNRKKQQRGITIRLFNHKIYYGIK